MKYFSVGDFSGQLEVALHHLDLNLMLLNCLELHSDYNFTTINFNIRLVVRECCYPKSLKTNVFVTSGLIDLSVNYDSFNLFAMLHFKIKTRHSLINYFDDHLMHCYIIFQLDNPVFGYEKTH